MAQPLGQDPSRPFAALAAAQVLAYQIQAAALGGLDKPQIRSLTRRSATRRAQAHEGASAGSGAQVGELDDPSQ